MQKSKLDKFISKYNLGGNVNSVKWKSNGDTLSTSFVTPDKSLLGSVTVDKFGFDSSELGVYRTAELQKLLGVLDDNISLSLTKVGDKAITLKVKNGGPSFDFSLSDLTVIPVAPQMKKIPTFETKIKLDSNFINTFVKGKSALAEVDTFTIIDNSERTGNVEIVIGYSKTNSDRVNIPVDTDTKGLDNKISFNANLFKEVLVANKECKSAVLEVSNEGLARVNFKIDDYDSTYYIVATQDID